MTSTVNRHNGSDDIFIGYSDTFGGNSGGGVFTSSGVLAGVLVAQQTPADYAFNAARGCTELLSYGPTHRGLVGGRLTERTTESTAIQAKRIRALACPEHPDSRHPRVLCDFDGSESDCDGSCIDELNRNRGGTGGGGDSGGCSIGGRSSFGGVMALLSMFLLRRRRELG